ncbi:winged helix-turn-helix transcriptional regulator [Salinigranum halophilum]|jgi:DNA-binding transcriptional ArsR family regulator|uniref:winged helix-turn-helix transcriptional regulator n=1 Tax=Salinigranum halophilum TaxID=2565931 RepID=UPI0010A94C5F|nr:helix-turn-helix domain-containing protein [Salinigranum halophilum]
MSRHRIRSSVIAVCAVVLVLLASLSGGVVAFETVDATEPNGDDVPSADQAVSAGPTGATELNPGIDRTRHATTPTAVPTATSAPTANGGNGLSLSPSLDGSLDDDQFAREVGDTLRGPSGLVVLAGYSRLDETDPLSHPLRAELYEAVAQSPGTYPTALTDRLDTPRSTLRYHLRVLEDADLVSPTAVDGRRRYVTTEAGAAERALVAVDEGTTAGALVEHLGREGTATVGDLADGVDRTTATVSYHLERLEEAGVVERTRDGQAVRNRLTNEVTPLVTSVVASDPGGYGAATDD